MSGLLGALLVVCLCVAAGVAGDRLSLYDIRKTNPDYRRKDRR